MLNHIVMIPIKKYPLLFALIVLTLTLATGCDRVADMCTEVPQSIRIHFNLSAEPLVSTRSAGSVDNSVGESTTISNLNIYIWNNLFSYHKYYSSAAAANMEIVTGNYNVVAIANAGRDLGEVDTSRLSTTTLAQLGIDAKRSPILTCSEKINITSAVDINLALKRTFSYLAFNFTIDNSFTDWTLLSYRLYNVPASTTIAPPAAGAYTDVALCTATTEYFPLNGATSASDETYLFENCRPNVPAITDTKERTRDKAPTGATYMELFCQHTDGRLFALRFYLGDGAPSSFALRRNTRTQYNITIYSESDARVTSTEAAYTSIDKHIIAPGASEGYYDMGTISYTSTDPRDLTGRCIPMLGIGTQLASKGGALQIYKEGAWGNCDSEAPATIPISNISGSTASMKYRAYIPAAFLNTTSFIQQHMQAGYQVAESDRQTLCSVDATTRFGYKATVRSSSLQATFVLAAENPATAWVDTSDPEKNTCIETAASNKNAKFVVQGSATLIKNFAGLYDDQSGEAVGSVTSKTTTSISGTFPVTKTAAYTLRFTTATITSAETNKNQTYMLNKNTITVQDAESRPTLNVTLQCKEGEGLFLRNATFDNIERAWTGTEEAAKLVYTQATSSGKVTVPAVFVPLRSGSITYTITVSDAKGAVLASKTVTNTITKKYRKITVGIGGLRTPSYYYSYYDEYGEGWGYTKYRFGVSISSVHDLDYVGKGTTFTIPITFDFRYNISMKHGGDHTYPPEYHNGVVTIGCDTIEGLQTTQTIVFKNNSQDIEIYPIKGGWGDRFAEQSSYTFARAWLDVVVGSYTWSYRGDGGIEAAATSSEILLPPDLQLDLAINKSGGGWIGTIE